MSRFLANPRDSSVNDTGRHRKDPTSGSTSDETIEDAPCPVKIRVAFDDRPAVLEYQHRNRVATGASLAFQNASHRRRSPFEVSVNGKGSLDLVEIESGRSAPGSNLDRVSAAEHSGRGDFGIQKLKLGFHATFTLRIEPRRRRHRAMLISPEIKRTQRSIDG